MSGRRKNRGERERREEWERREESIRDVIRINGDGM
ncbi:hypothetical protein BCD_1043 (plasmid) [Borrelia crocidurae DOU]|uniref:Uncharacterized protein n=1 Tax=Borrelia crocidurae DOU TaxID=1293575 RepID=W5SIY0_9SPIR|nr:hypothetical protein BCD_1043 [Borrelia crocidurae DOU]